jgi:putative glutamine amidotransferase
MKPLIGIIPGSHISPEGRRLDLPVMYGDAVARAGGLPVLLAGGPDGADAWPQRLDGLLLAGGGDVSPTLYGQDNRGSQGVDERRDQIEIALTLAFWEARKPILGICRGIQVLCVALGGALIQDIGQELRLVHPYSYQPCHDVEIRRECFLRPILGASHAVNSTHHQALRDIPPSLIPCAWAEAGRITEAVEAADGRPVWGVQWHPERLTGDPAMGALFTAFIERCFPDAPPGK